MKKSFIIILLTISFSHSAKGIPATFIDVSKTLDSLENGLLHVENLTFDLPSCIYLDCSLKKRVLTIDSSYLKKKIHYYFCEERDAYLIKLHDDYKSIEDVVKSSDAILVDFLKEQFDFKFRDLDIPILKYRNKVLLEFYYNYRGGEVMLELINSKTLRVELIYILHSQPLIKMPPSVEEERRKAIQELDQPPLK